MLWFGALCKYHLARINNMFQCHVKIFISFIFSVSLQFPDFMINMVPIYKILSKWSPHCDIFQVWRVTQLNNRCAYLKKQGSNKEHYCGINYSENNHCFALKSDLWWGINWVNFTSNSFSHSAVTRMKSIIK